QPQSHEQRKNRKQDHRGDQGNQQLALAEFLRTHILLQEGPQIIRFRDRELVRAQLPLVVVVGQVVDTAVEFLPGQWNIGKTSGTENARLVQRELPRRIRRRILALEVGETLHLANQGAV